MMNPTWISHAWTWLRIALIPALLGLLYRHETWATWACFGVFLIAGVSDILDGFWARRRKDVSRIGAFLDPLADKLLGLSLLVGLVGLPSNSTWLVVLLMLILATEISIAALEGIGMAATIDLMPAVRTQRLKTVVQFVALAVILLQRAWSSLSHFYIGGILLVGSTLLGLLGLGKVSVRLAKGYKET